MTATKLRKGFQKRPFNPTLNYKGKTIPDQSMDIKELVRRYVKGIPADVVQRDKVYVDQVDHDLEKLARLDPTDRAYTAQNMRAQNEYVAERAREEAERLRTEKERRAKEQAKRGSEDEHTSGIGDLDNTMPDDTDLNARPLPERRPAVKGGSKKASQ